MQEIKFNHNYKKLHNQKTARLLSADFFYGKDLHKDFVEYDTEGKYEIDKEQEYIKLLFRGDKGIPFTTLRKNNDENRKKYCSLTADTDFKIVIEEKNNGNDTKTKRSNKSKSKKVGCLCHRKS